MLHTLHIPKFAGKIKIKIKASQTSDKEKNLHPRKLKIQAKLALCTSSISLFLFYKLCSLSTTAFNCTVIPPRSGGQLRTPPPSRTRRETLSHHHLLAGLRASPQRPPLSSPAAGHEPAAPRCPPGASAPQPLRKVEPAGDTANGPWRWQEGRQTPAGLGVAKPWQTLVLMARTAPTSCDTRRQAPPGRRELLAWQPRPAHRKATPRHASCRQAAPSHAGCLHHPSTATDTHSSRKPPSAPFKNEEVLCRTGFSPSRLSRVSLVYSIPGRHNAPIRSAGCHEL